MLTHTSRRHLAAILFYTLLALLLTWPLVARFTTHVPGNGVDDPALAWNLWWLKARLVDQHNVDIFHVDWMFHPIDINLAFYTLTPLNGLLSIPLQTSLSLIIASNILLLATFILSGYGTYLLAFCLLHEDRSQSPIAYSQSQNTAALIAGVIYAFASSKLFYASLGQFNIASSHWIPFCVLYVVQMGKAHTAHTRLRCAALAALFLIFQAWSELTYASFLIIFIALYFLWELRIPHFALRILSPTFLLAGLFLLGISPFLWAMLPDMVREGDFAASGGGFSDTFSADLLGYLVPTRLHPLLGGGSDSFAFPNNVGQQIYIGYTALALTLMGVIALRRSGQRQQVRQGWFWLFNIIFFWLLTLGPHLRWNGRELAIPGPFSLFNSLPFLNLNRYPSRYSVMLMLFVALLSCYGAWWLLQRGAMRSGRFRQRSSLLAYLLIALFLFEHLSVPLPTHYSVTPAIYAQIAAEPGDFTVLELPTGWRNGARVLGKEDVLIMMQQWFQSVHGKRRLGGNTSRNPPYKFQYFSDAPLIGDLIALMNADDRKPYLAAEVETELATIIARNRQTAAQVLDFLGVKFVTVHVDSAPPALLRFIDEALPLTLIDEWRGPGWTGEPHTIRLYRVNETPTPTTWTVDLATEYGNLYLAEGWSAWVANAQDVSAIRYAIRSRADLLLDLPTTGGTLDLELFGPAEAVEIWLNGRYLTTAEPEAGASPHRVSLAVPSGLAAALVDRLELRFQGLVTSVPHLVTAPDPRGWPIGQTGSDLPSGKAIVARGAGNDAGDFVQIFINGTDVVSQNQWDAGEPGYFLAALNQQGELLAAARFNTLAAASESVAMAAWLSQWPTGTIIAGAVADTAVREAPNDDKFLGQDALDALGNMGVAGDLRGKHRWSHAFIGVVGAAPGTAVEAIELLKPATVAVGSPITGANIHGGVGRIHFEPH